MGNYNLFYDAETQKFSITPSRKSIVVFETHNREGWINGKDEITQGPFRIEIRTNFYPKSPEREYLCANIYVNDIFLLPISLAWRKTVTYHTDITNDIFMEEWGNNPGVICCYQLKPSTVVHLRKWMTEKELEWCDFLLSVCQVCNDYGNWIVTELRQLIEKMQGRNKIHWSRLALVVSLVRRYDKLAPEIIKVYRPFFDKKVIEGLRIICGHMDRKQIGEVTLQKKFPMQEANILWKYANDYLM